MDRYRAGLVYSYKILVLKDYLRQSREDGRLFSVSFVYDFVPFFYLVLWLNFVLINCNTTVHYSILIVLLRKSFKLCTKNFNQRLSYPSPLCICLEFMVIRNHKSQSIFNFINFIKRGFFFSWFFSPPKRDFSSSLSKG